MNIEIEVKIEEEDDFCFKTYTISKEELLQLICDRGLKDHPGAYSVRPSTGSFSIIIGG